ncbi:capsid protein [Porcine genomovirus-3]|nr:capsid protein [Porcine genomovirus-3]UBQ66275.1 Cap protein [finch CRESS-DNA virus]
MAFRRRSFRRTGRSYRRRGNARTSRGRTSGRGGYNRRRYTGRRRKMTSRRVRDIASRKKYDTIFGATTNDVQSTGQANIFAGTNYFMWCPTWRQRRTASTDEHVRANQEVFMRGIKDRIMVSATFSLIHRRVCFWSHRRIDDARPFVFDNPDVIDAPSYQRRNLVALYPNLDEEIFEYLFKGTVGFDYSENSRWDTPLDNKRVKVVYDKQYTITPNYAAPDGAQFGKTLTRKLWHPINRKVLYDDDEEGADVNGSGWSAQTPESLGNYYVLDIFSTGQYIEGSTDQVGTYMPESTTYWHEAS